MRVILDIETNGLLHDLTHVHCLVLRDIDTGQILAYDDTGERESITQGLTYLMEADEIWGHNTIMFDYPALRSIYPFFNPWKAKSYDTLILSRMFYTDMLERDMKNPPANMPGNLWGRHSLEAWGYRLGEYKGTFGKTADWSTYSPEMLEYCIRDTLVTKKLVDKFTPAIDKYQPAITLEMEVAGIMAKQEEVGFPFDVRRAYELEDTLRSELETLSDQMRDTFPQVAGRTFTPKRDNKTLGYIAGAGFCEYREFNPTSRDHIAWAFEHYRGWEPIELTKTGKPVIDEDVLRGVGTEEALAFARILELQKHLGQLADGAKAWLKVQRDGKIHHSCFLNTATGRNAHNNPNLAQVPSGPEYRSLFLPWVGDILVGADASSLELRCLAHYLAYYDGGDFGKEVINGDIHQAMADISGVDRKTQKSVTYCLIYGGGNQKLGLTAGASKKEAAKVGKDLRGKLLKGIPALGKLTEAVSEKAERTGKLVAIDGRPIKIRKGHAALNYLLQSCGAIICKRWVLGANQQLQADEVDYRPLAFVHDEMQLSVKPAHKEVAENDIINAMARVETDLNFRVPLDCEVKFGATWAETH